MKLGFRNIFNPCKHSDTVILLKIGKFKIYFKARNQGKRVVIADR